MATQGNTALRGLDELVGTIHNLQNKTAKKSAKAGVNAGLAVLTRSMRSAVMGSSASDAMKKAARQTVAKRLLAKEGRPTVGKAGFGVGKRSAAAKARISAQLGKRGHRGVGISAYNIHWPVLGTQDRFVGIEQRRDKKTKQWKPARLTGNPIHAVGRMPPILKGVVDKAVASAEAAAMEAARKKVEQVLAADAAKARKG